MFIFGTDSRPLEFDGFFDLSNFFPPLGDLRYHIFNNFFVFFEKIFLRVSVSDFSVEQFEQNVIELTPDHLVIHDM